ncbi:MAG: hypothetical protein ACOCX4_07810 [Planctomycetota bacterium]
MTRLVFGVLAALLIVSVLAGSGCVKRDADYEPFQCACDKE